eukprot:jgi/Hompol1/1345/HPOL_001085-RA
MDDLDFQGGGGGSATDEELTLPKATLAKLIQELLPSDIQTTKETRDLLGDCCVANEISERESKKTISGEHVIQALKVLSHSYLKPFLLLVPQSDLASLADTYMLCLVTVVHRREQSLGFDDYVTDMEEVMQEHTKSLKVRIAC